LHRWCAASNCRLIHISTDCVFDGVRGQYRETDDSNARDVYGKSKFLGETDDREAAAVTLRTSIIGRELGTGHGLVEWFLAQQGKSVKGFRKAIFTGFTTHELANVITQVIRQNPPLRGLYQVASPPIDKFELLGLLRDAFRLQIDIQPDEEFVCDRSLRMDRFAEATGYRAPDWREMIATLAADPTPYR
jgi:dTDP-4-dehydrorhamnose reductase